MSSITRFKWQRALGGFPDRVQSHYFRFNLHNMRQQFIQLSPIVTTGGVANLFVVNIPKSSWANKKALLIRGAYQIIQPAVGAPPSYQIPELIALQGALATTIYAGTPFTPSPGIGSTFMERYLVRDDPNVLIFDQASCFNHPYADGLNNTEFVKVVTPFMGPFDYSLNIALSVQMDVTAAYPGLQILPLWAEGFLEQGTNLGTLS